MYIFNNKALKYMTQNLTKLKEGLLQILIILSQKLIEWISGQNVSQSIDNLNTNNHLVLADIYRMLYQMTTEYMFFHIYHMVYTITHESINFKWLKSYRYIQTHIHRFITTLSLWVCPYPLEASIDIDTWYCPKADRRLQVNTDRIRIPIARTDGRYKNSG